MEFRFIGSLLIVDYQLPLTVFSKEMRFFLKRRAAQLNLWESLLNGRKIAAPSAGAESAITILQSSDSLLLQRKVTSKRC